MRFVNMKEMGCFTNDLKFINNKIFGWYRDDIKDSDLEEALAKFYGKVSNIPGFIIMFIQWFGINLRDSNNLIMKIAQKDMMLMNIMKNYLY